MSGREPRDTIDRLRESLGDRYRIDRELGRGGMATVFLAYDTKHDRQVAFKVLDPDVAAPLAPGRFQREIRLAARLHHPHILAVYESGAVDDILWFTMPYVDGETLRQRMKRVGPLPVSEAIRIAREAARALDYSHRNGVVHRDIKPENILLTREGDTLIADFGIGRALGGSDSGAESADSRDGTLTTAGVLIGTPRYMSVEQADGKPLDGRTDIYSLGVVLYEMLAGEPPFPGSTVHSVVAHQLAGPPPSLRAARPDVPAELERVVLQMLESDRDRRPASAAAVLEALGTDSGATPVPRAPIRGSRRWVAPALCGAALILVAVGVYRWRTARPPALGRAVVAVAPFDVPDARLSLWREGLVDLLSRDLDGAGPLRSVPPTVVIRRWSGRADPPSAAGLGRHTGAGLAVYGSLLGSGPDSVRLRATLLDVERERALGEWELADATDRMDRLTDSLTVLVLEELGRTRPIGAVRRTGLRRTSAPALKAFLQGEQHYRQGWWDSALVSYERAIAADSGFAPALRRAGQALGWVSSGFDSLATAYILRAAALNHGLPARDSLLLVADSLLASLLEAGPLGIAADSAWMPRLRRLRATLEYATGNWPDDPEAWFSLGEFEAHLGPFAGRTLDQRVHAFDRAIALDSGFAPSYFHQVDAAVSRGPEAVRRYLDPYFRLGTKDVTADAGRLFLGLLDSPGDSAGVAAFTRGVPDVVLLSTLHLFGSLPDSAERVVSLVKVVAGRSMPSSPPYDNPLFRTSQVGRALMSRGHLRAAGPFLAAWPNSLFFGEAMLLGAVPADLGVQVSRERLAGPVTPWLVALFPWWADRRDTISLGLAAARADSVARLGADPDTRSLARYAAASAAAYGALGRADTADAIARFLALSADGCPACVLDRLTTARLLEERRRDHEAWQLLQGEYPFATLDPTAAEIHWVLLRGRVGERLGHREPAIQSFAWVAGMWRNADDELQPYVREAQEGIERLTGE